MLLNAYMTVLYIYFTLYSQKQHGLSYDNSMFRQIRAYPFDLGYFRVLVCWAQIELKAALFLQSKLPERLMKTRNGSVQSFSLFYLKVTAAIDRTTRDMQIAPNLCNTCFSLSSVDLENAVYLGQSFQIPDGLGELYACKKKLVQCSNKVYW